MNQIQRWIIPTVLLFSLGGNIYFLLSRVEFRMGGGYDDASPNRAYHAWAVLLHEKNPLSPQKDNMWGELSIRRKGFDVIRLIVTPPGTDNEQAYRQIEGLIQWSADSKTATYRLPNATISVTPQETQ